MPDQHRQFRILYRDFLFRILDLELLASRGVAQRLLGQFAAMLAAFSFTFTMYFVPRYGLSTLPWEKLSRLGWVDQDLLIATTMAIAGLFTVLAWNNVLPDRRDCLILGLLPVRQRTVFLTKLAALGTALGVAIAALNAFTGLAYPFAIAPPGSGTLAVLRGFGAYWTTMFAAGLLVCCALLSIQAIAANLLPYRLFLKLSGVLQMAAFFAILGVYFLKPPYTAGLTWLPSFWFLGLFQKLSGVGGFDPLAATALRALCIVCPLAMVAFPLAFHRYNRRIVEQPDIAPSDRSRPAMRLVGWLAAKLIPRTVERAILLFTARTIARSRHHRLLLAAYGGIGLAVALAYARDLLYGSRSYERIWNKPRWDQPNPPLLVGSLVLLFFAVMGARAVFSQPIALRANWIFRLTAAAPRRIFCGCEKVAVRAGSGAHSARMGRALFGHLAHRSGRAAHCHSHGGRIPDGAILAQRLPQNSLRLLVSPRESQHARQAGTLRHRLPVHHHAGYRAGILGAPQHHGVHRAVVRSAGVFRLGLPPQSHLARCRDSVRRSPARRYRSAQSARPRPSRRQAFAVASTRDSARAVLARSIFPGLGQRHAADSRRKGRPHVGSAPGLTYFAFSASAASTSSLCFMGLTLVQTCTILPVGSIRNVLRDATPLGDRDPYSSTTFLSVSASNLNVRLSFVQNCLWLSALSTLTPTMAAFSLSYLGRSCWKL